MRRLFLVVGLLYFVYPFVAENEGNYLFKEKTEVAKFSFQTGEVYVLADNPAQVQIPYMVGRPEIKRWKNIRISLDVAEDEKEWIKWNMEEEEKESWYFEIHIKKSTLEAIDILVKQELIDKKLFEEVLNKDFLF